MLQTKAQHQTLLKQYNPSEKEQRIANIPLQWEHITTDIISKQLTKLNHPHPYRIHYLGPRPTYSLQVHKKYGRSEESTEEIVYPNTQNQLYYLRLHNINPCSFVGKQQSQYKTTLFYRAFQGSNPSLSATQDYVFNSAFQGGNLDCVVKTAPGQFDLFLRIDSNTRGHTGWYFFSIKNGSLKEKLTLNICNLRKPSPLYEQGMRPYVFSRIAHHNQGTQWCQAGENIRFAPCQLIYNHISSQIDTSNNYKLSFEFTFTHEEDEVFFAYCIPYTYSQLQQDIRKYEQSPYVKRLTLGRTLTGLDLPLLHITNHKLEGKKKIIVITGRVHPGQSNSSYMVKGLIELLLTQSKQMQELRNSAHVFVVPMLNPDGVVMGNTRTSAAGKDLNRQFIEPELQLYPECHQLKTLVQRLQTIGEVMLYLDFHGHSRRKNTFLYGPNYQLQHLDYYRCRFLPKLIQKNNPTFRYYSCNFNIPEDKKSTARAVMLNQLKIPYVSTIESSIGLFYSPTLMKTLPFTSNTWYQMGESICKAISMFNTIIAEQQVLQRERSINRYQQKGRSSTSMGIRHTKRYSTEQYLEFVSGKPSNNNPLYTQLLKQIKSNVGSKANDEGEDSDDHDDEQNLPVFKANMFKQHIILVNKNNKREIKVQESKQQDLNFEFITVKPLINGSKLNKCSQKKIQTVAKRISTSKKKKTSAMYFKQKTPADITKTIDFAPNLQKKLETEDSFKSRNSLHDPPKMLNSFMKYQTKTFSTGKPRYSLTTKNLYPIDTKQQAPNIPKSLQAIRKEMKKGRILIHNLQQSRMKFIQKESLDKNIRRERKGPFVSADLSKMRMGHKSSTSHFDSPLSSYTNFNKQTQPLLMDPPNYASLEGLQVDNLAMTITTFKRR